MEHSTQKRAFRTPDSIEAEIVTRRMLKPFLEGIGCTGVRDLRKGNSQLLTATTPEGKKFTARVRLCWRWEDHPEKYSAAQLRARLSDSDWDKTIAEIVDREAPQGVTHSLLIQRYGSAIKFAALIPVEAITGIINGQKEVSAKLIAQGKLGRLKKNHAVNGDSPTMWLMDNRYDEAHEVAAVLWQWPGVEDLARRLAIEGPLTVSDDTLSDLPGIDLLLLGRDQASRFQSTVSKVARDPQVRKAVIDRCGGRCERPGCGAGRSYSGFLDVHHILGAEVSDRVWNCVALCPNCHRDAHFSMDREVLNDSLIQAVKHTLQELSHDNVER
ncbi:HNH endonuclease signature motif containing protein [Pseudomonas syringae]|uniref:HNH endonuclease signature motif containing protein n=1 Tax=Pseudomonas syringae TaxID=317 RepID=UPI0011D053E4|nr:HNH endonuclease signature motif containing protein [Pseudomonas syringae]